MKIALVNARYNADLGDAVVAECIEFGLRQRLPGAHIFSCDLSGRKANTDRSPFLQNLSRSFLPVTPEAIKNKLLVAVVRNKLVPHYDKTINGADLAVFCGGEIFADTDENFPLKIAASASIVRSRRIPVAIHAVGVGADWSDNAVALFNEAFAGADICWTSVRDDLSRNRWRAQFRNRDIPAPNVTMDPGLLAGKAFSAPGESALPPRNRPLIGLCVTDPSNFSSRSDVDDTGRRAPDVAFYQASIKALIANDCDVLLFTGGAPDDEAFLAHCIPATSLTENNEGALLVARQSKTPGQLVDTIRRCDAVAGSQLHACVIAQALKIPHVGVSVKPSLDAFFDMVGRREFLLDPGSAAPDAVAAAVLRALDTPITDSAHALITNRVERDFDELARILERAANGKRPLTPRPRAGRRRRGAHR